MNYAAFYNDVVEWINQVNQAAVQYGMDNEQFWSWVVHSSGAIGNKYQNNRLVVNQMVMLIEWLEEVYEARKVKNHEEK